MHVPPMRIDTLSAWHGLVAKKDPSGLDTLLADDVVFHSPLVQTPQVGKALATRYLAAAFEVFLGGSFEYVREVGGPRDAVLEFEATIDGVEINGVDMLKWDEEGKIVDFKVMIRPLLAIKQMHRKVAAVLGGGQEQSPSRSP